MGSIRTFFRFAPGAFSSPARRLPNSQGTCRRPVREAYALDTPIEQQFLLARDMGHHLIIPFSLVVAQFSEVYGASGGHPGAFPQIVGQFQLGQIP